MQRLQQYRDRCAEQVDRINQKIGQCSDITLVRLAQELDRNHSSNSGEVTCINDHSRSRVDSNPSVEDLVIPHVQNEMLRRVGYYLNNMVENELRCAQIESLENS